MAIYRHANRSTLSCCSSNLTWATYSFSKRWKLGLVPTTKFKFCWQTKCSLAIDCSYNATNNHIKDNFKHDSRESTCTFGKKRRFLLWRCGPNYPMVWMRRKKYKIHDYKNIFEYNTLYKPYESLYSIYLEVPMQLKTSASIYKPTHQGIFSTAWRPCCFVYWHRLFANTNAIHDTSPHTKHIYHGWLHRAIQPSGCLAATLRAC